MFNLLISRNVASKIFKFWSKDLFEDSFISSLRYIFLVTSSCFYRTDMYNNEIDQIEIKQTTVQFTLSSETKVDRRNIIRVTDVSNQCEIMNTRNGKSRV